MNGQRKLDGPTIDAAIAVARAEHKKCSEAIAECDGWSPAQAEWCRARDRCTDIIDGLEALR